MQYALWIAAAVSATAFYIHTFIGGKRVARPLLDNTTLPKASKWLNYYCWHIATVILALLAVTYTVVPFINNTLPLILFLAAMTTSAGILSAVIEVKAGAKPLAFPSTSLFMVISVCTWTAVFTALN